MDSQENHKPWSWTEKQVRRHTPSRYRHMMQKRKGWLDRFQNKQRTHNRARLYKLVMGIAEEVDFMDKHRHDALWELN
jgi:hypothetical protein